MKLRRLPLLACWLFSFCTMADTAPTLRIGVQALGTLEWELSVLKQPPDANFQIQIYPLANAEAGKIALQSGAVDIIVSDWLWVSAMREKGVELSFYPYSSTSGALMVAADNPIHALKELKGKRLGIAGGELDKNWLLLQAAAKQQQTDLSWGVEKTFGAPPLINEQIKQGRVDAVLNYWHFAAKLEAQGYRQIIDGKGLLKAIGVNETIPFLGFVFQQSWADSHKAALSDFFKASRQAKNQLCTDDAAWLSVQPLTKEADPAILKILRQRYCEGRVAHWGTSEQQAAARLYPLLGVSGQQPATGGSSLQPGTFWAAE